MNKIKNVFSEMINSVKETLEKFPITTIIVFVCTLIVTFLVIETDFSASVDEFIAHILTICGLASIGTWFIEALFEEEQSDKRVIGYVISFVIAIVLDRVIKLELLEDSFLTRVLIEYIIVGLSATLYVLAKKSGEKFEKYILNVTLNVKRTSTIFGIIAAGFFGLYSIFTLLILNSSKFYIVEKIICLFAGFYYVPVLLKSCANEEAEDTKFHKIVFSKVLLPLIFLAMSIIYIYIVKIFFITEVPKNELFAILAAIFIGAYPVYIINKNYGEKDTMLYKINKAIPYLYIPFIFLQMYALGIRIGDYGLTTSRYMGCALIVYEIVAISLAIVKNSEYLKEIILATAVISVIITITPFNYDRLPLLSQKAIVDNYVKQGVSFDDMEDTDKKKFAGAYQYIQYDEEYVNSALSQIEKDKLSSYNTYRYSYTNSETEEKFNKTQNCYLTKNLGDFNISAYRKISEIPYSYNTEGTIIESHNVVDFTIDLEEYAQEIIEANEISKATAERVFEEMEVVEVDENRDIFLTMLSITYQKDTKEIDYVRIEGYLLEK